MLKPIIVCIVLLVSGWLSVAAKNASVFFISASKETVPVYWIYGDMPEFTPVAIYDSDYMYPKVWKATLGLNVSGLTEHLPEGTYAIISDTFGTVTRPSFSGSPAVDVNFSILAVGLMTRFDSDSLSLGFAATTGFLFHDKPESPVEDEYFPDAGKTEGLGYGLDADLGIRLGRVLTVYADASFYRYDHYGVWRQGPIITGFGYGYGIRLSW